jgi:tripeptide aminopeptidase
LVNAIKIASEFVAALPKDSWSPETTENLEGYIHPTSIDGNQEKAVVKFIIRDFETPRLAEHEARLESILKEIVARYPGARYEFVAVEQYRNMMDVLKDLPFVMDYAEEAMVRAGITPSRSIIRGGTDGSRLSFMGLPCPNLFTGEMAIHSKLEYVSVQDMQKAVDTCVELVKIWEEKG